MKKFILVSLFVSFQLQAAIINLRVGETITLLANQNTTVTCGYDAVNCDNAVKRFKSRFNTCLSATSTEECINTVWVDFKKSNPYCVAEGSDYCLDRCIESLDTTWCLNKCK